jgi:chromosome segregation ATPase
MILECGNCSKMYRIRDDAAPQPTQCPTCKGDLRVAGGGTATTGASRVKELETRIQNLEKELEETRSFRPTLSVESSFGFSGSPAPVAELRAGAEKSDRLERELLATRSEMESRLKEKELEIAQLRETHDREAAERRKQETRAGGLEETHARALEGKDKTIAALDASIASYRSKVETLQKKLDALEIQRLNDLNAFDSRVREREQSDRAALDRATAAQQKALADLRVEMEEKIAEKDRLITEGRQALDREAGERRRLTETLNRLQENADRAVAEKQTAITALDATLASYKSKTEALQKRVDSLEQMRRSEHDQVTKHTSSRQAVLGRLDEASHLAVDLDHSLDSIEASIAALRDRARRLSATLQDSVADAEAAPAPLASLASSLAPEPEPEESAPPVLSQTDPWFDERRTPAPAPEPEPQAEAEVVEEQILSPDPEPEPEPPAYSPVTRTQIKPNLYAEPLPDEIEAVPATEPPLIDSDPVSRLDEPSVMMTAHPGAPAPEPSASAAEEPSEDLPLISPPEETPPPPPAAAAPEPPKKKFSWQRK